MEEPPGTGQAAGQGQGQEVKPSTIGNELLAALGTIAIAYVCLLIPIAHFVIGPLGPVIGAFVMSCLMRV